MTVIEICKMNDLSVPAVEKALAGMQEKGLITGFVPGNLTAEITPTASAAFYKN